MRLFWMIALYGLLLTPLAAAEQNRIRIGMIGLDTSHSVAFTKILNDPDAPPELSGCRMTVAYPQGSPDIESSVSRIPKYTEEVQKYGVKIVDSIAELLNEVDAVLLETNDGRPHLEQVRPVIAAGKPVFIDKPVAGSLADAITIYREAEQAGVPVFSSSSLRFGKNTQLARNGGYGPIQSCETFSPASLEPSHPDLFWYGIHGVESLFTVMGTGCQMVQRSVVDGQIVVNGVWKDGRVGVFREGKGYGGEATGAQQTGPVGNYDGYQPLVVEIVKFFRSGIAPVSTAETLEIYAFMEAADESKRRGGEPVTLTEVMMTASGFQPLFNGKDLTGWKGLVGNPKTRAAMTTEELAAAQQVADEEMQAHWKVVAGELVFDGQGKNLCTAQDYGDFELYLDWKILAGGDSGVYLRGAPQVQIWDTNHEPYFKHGADQGSGSLWNNQQHPRFPLVKADRPVGEWNTFFIRMVGERVTIYLNDQLVVDDVVLENYWDRERPIAARGSIELQNHGNTLWFRNLYIREIPADEANAMIEARQAKVAPAESVFNGTDFSGWQGATTNYEVKLGAIVCKPGQGGNLLTEKMYDNFVARLQFRLPEAGNNGLIARYPGAGAPHLAGIELQVLDSEHPKYTQLHPTQYHGSVYGCVPAQRGYLRPTGEWNTQQVKLNGSQIQVELNGTVILDADLSSVTESKEGPVPAGLNNPVGYFGFAGHNDPVEFRNIMIGKIAAAEVTGE